MNSAKYISFIRPKRNKSTYPSLHISAMAKTMAITDADAPISVLNGATFWKYGKILYAAMKSSAPAMPPSR